MDPHTSTYFVILHLSIHVTASAIRHPFFRPPHLALNVNVQLVTQHAHTSPTTSTPDPIPSSKPSTHRYVPDLPLRLPSFMCNTVHYPYPFYLPPLFYLSILSRLSLSSSTTSAVCTYLVHGSYTRTVHCASTLRSTSCTTKIYIAYTSGICACISN